MTDWLPAETAPDRVYVLIAQLVYGKPSVDIAIRADDHWIEVSPGPLRRSLRDDDVLGWRPLPEAPAEKIRAQPPKPPPDP